MSLIISGTRSLALVPISFPTCPIAAWVEALAPTTELEKVSIGTSCLAPRAACYRMCPIPTRTPMTQAAAASAKFPH